MLFAANALFIADAEILPQHSGCFADGFNQPVDIFSVIVKGKGGNESRLKAIHCPISGVTAK
jgi:hypothetical protein